MNFIDLEKLKIITEHNYSTKELDLQMSPAAKLSEIREITRSSIAPIIEKTKIEMLYEITINTDEKVESLDDADAFFTTTVNIIGAIFLDLMCASPHTGRARERRLDVPEKLKVVQTNMSMLKRAVNMQTYCDRFNLIIKWVAKVGDGLVDYQYTMVPQKGDDNHD